jgi:hypothetical protein
MTQHTQEKVVADLVLNAPIVETHLSLMYRYNQEVKDRVGELEEQVTALQNTVLSILIEWEPPGSGSLESALRRLVSMGQGECLPRPMQDLIAARVQRGQKRHKKQVDLGGVQV